jgi:hypothetical protein
LALASHGKRLEQCVQRLRAGGFGVRWVDNHLYSETGDDVSVTASLAPAAAGVMGLPAELARRVEFAKRDVMAAMDVPERTATRLCAAWVAAGAVSRTGAGPRSRYRPAQKP